MESSFRDNITRSRYELDEGWGLVFADYISDPDGPRIVTHVETPVEARGAGAAGRLMEAIVADARAHKRPHRVYCSYAAAWLRKHPEARDILS